MKSVSVVIPCYNAESYIAETIESVLNQTYLVNEIIVIDDGSTDRSATVAESFGATVKVVRQKNRGECGARNRGVLEASGELIAFLDADDLWHQRKIELQIDYLNNNPEVGAVTASTSVMKDGRHVEVVTIKDDMIRQMEPRDFLVHACVSQSGVVVKADLARAAPYPEGVTNSGDMIQTVLLRTKTRIGSVEEPPLIFYRKHAGQVTQTEEHYIRSLKFRVAWARENYQLIGAESASAAAVFVLMRETERVMTLYWSRNTSRFKVERDELLGLWPSKEKPPKELTRFVAPRLILRLRDMVGRRVRGFK